MHWKGLSLMASASVLFTACGEQPEARVYTIPKETVSAPAPASPPMMAGDGGSMATTSLPDEFLNQNAVLPEWRVPPTWQPVDGSAMRLASFVVEDGGASLDISVTSFPGDVGGLLANVNRWRRQLNLPPTTQAEVEESVGTISTLSGDATFVELSNGTTDTLAAILMHDQASWFIKLTGPSALAAREADHFRAFVESINFAATHNH